MWISWLIDGALAQILEMKVQKLEQLVRLKDGKIQTLVAKLRSQKPQS